MSDVGQFFLGVGATAAGVALMALPVPGGRFLGTALISFGVGQIASGIAGRPSNEDMQSNVGSPEATLPVVYGTAKIGLKLNETWVNPNSSDREELIRGGIACVGSEDGSGIDSFERIWIDEVLAVNPVTEGDNASMRTGGVTSFFSDVVSYIAFRGTDTQPVPTPLNNRDSSRYPNDWRSRGLAHIQFALDKDKEVLPRPPNVTVEVRGNHVYDPRDSTWKFSNNPALVLLDYLTSSRYGADLFYPERDGGDTDLSEIDEQSFIDAANFCDEQVQDGSGGTQKRFTFDGWLDTGNRLNDNVNGILATMRGTLIHQTGKFRLVIRKAKSSSRTLDESDLVGNWRIRRGGSGKIPNRVVVKYGGGTRGDVTGDVQWPEVGDTTFLDQDAGHEKTMSVKLVGVQDEVRAQQIGMVLLKEAREDAALSVEAHASAMDLQVGEVVTIDHATPGWEGSSAKDFWIVGMELLPQERVRLTLKEYAASAYSLDAQTAPTPPPGSNLPDPTSTGAPSNLSLTSDSTTQQQTPAGDKIPRILATWDLPLDKGIDRVVVLERENGTAQWNVAGVVDPTDDQRLLFEPEGGKEGDTWEVGVYVVQGQRLLKSSITTGTVGLDTDFVASDILGEIVDVDLQESDFDSDGVVEGRLLVDVIDSGSYDLQFLTRQGRGTSWTNGANPTGVQQGDPTESDDVELVEAENSFIALDVFEAGTSTRVGRRLIFTFDPDNVAHVTGIGVAIEDDGTPVVDAGGDSDTVKIYVTVTTDGSEPADPTSSNADATINARQGSVTLSSLTVPKGGKARAKARGENAATELAPASTVKSDQDGRPGAQTNLDAAPVPTFELVGSDLDADTLQYRIDGVAGDDTVGPIEVAWDVVADITSPSFGAWATAPQDVQVDRPELTESGANVRFIVFKVRDAGTTGNPESEQQVIPIAPVHRRGMDGRGRVDEEEHTSGGDFPGAGGGAYGPTSERDQRSGVYARPDGPHARVDVRSPDGKEVLADHQNRTVGGMDVHESSDGGGAKIVGASARTFLGEDDRTMRDGAIYGHGAGRERDQRGGRGRGLPDADFVRSEVRSGDGKDRLVNPTGHLEPPLLRESGGPSVQNAIQNLLASGNLSSAARQETASQTRLLAKGTQTGTAADGDPVSFSPNFSQPPVVIIVPAGRTVVGSVSSDQYMVLAASGLDSQGFTLRAVMQDRSSTTGVVDSFDESTADTPLDTDGDAWSLANKAEGEAGGAGLSDDAVDDQYIVNYDGSVSVTETSGLNFTQATATLTVHIEVWNNDAGSPSWRGVSSKQYQVTATQGQSNTNNFGTDTQSFSDANIDGGDDIRIRCTLEATASGGGSWSGSFSVSTNRVNYTSATVTEFSMSPNDELLRWIAFEGV